MLKKYLPEIILIGEKRAQLLIEGGDAVFSAAGNLQGDLTASAALCVVPALEAIGETIASLDVSLKASGEVLTSVNN